LLTTNTLGGLHQNYPIPFAKGTSSKQPCNEYRIGDLKSGGFHLDLWSRNAGITVLSGWDRGFVTLTIYNVAGEKVSTLVSENPAAGIYRYQWETQGLASGVYFWFYADEKDVVDPVG
jgi:hypothetical protein